MKRLRKFAISLDRTAWQTEVAYPFYLASRSMCNFVERRLKTESVHLVDSTKLVICGVKSTSSSLQINSSAIASLYVPIDFLAYERLQFPEAKNAFMTEFAIVALLKHQGFKKGQVDELVRLIEAFQANGFVNEWTAAVRTLGHRSLQAELHCALTVAEFVLTLRVFKSDVLVYSVALLKTDPDELAYHHRFKEIQLCGEDLLVTTRLHDSKPLARIPIKDISLLGQ